MVLKGKSRLFYLQSLTAVLAVGITGSLEAAAQQEKTNKNLHKVVERLEHKDRTKRWEGLDEFQKLAPPFRALVVPELQHLLKDPRTGGPCRATWPCVRWFAARALRYVDSSTAQETLREAALTDPDEDVCRAAAGAVSDQSTATDLAGSSRRCAREEALRAIKDQGPIASIVMSHPQSEVRGDALFALTDENTLARIAERDPDPAVRAWADMARHADPTRDLRVGMVPCKQEGRAADGSGYVFKCTVNVTNRGKVTYGGLQWRATFTSQGDVTIIPSSRIGAYESDLTLNPGETKGNALWFSVPPGPGIVTTGILVIDVEGVERRLRPPP